MPQTTYGTKPAIATLGMIADVGYDNVVMSASAAINVYVGSLSVFASGPTIPPDAGTVTEITDSAASIAARVGICLYDATRMPYNPATTNLKAQWSAQETVPVLVRGRVWVYTEAATAITDPVFVRVLAAGNNVKGQFINATTTNFIAFPGTARWVTSTTGAGLIQLEIK